MKAFKFGLVAILAVVAAAGSGFTFKAHHGPNTVYYFANTTQANPPGTNDYLFESTTDPGASHCSMGVPICYGSSSSAPDDNNHPTGTVTTLHSGKWSN